MEQGIGIRATVGDFPPSDFRDGRWIGSEPRTAYESRVSVLFVGPRLFETELTAEGVRLIMSPANDALAHLRAGRAADILWLSAAETLDNDSFTDLCGAISERGCAVVCETSLAALDGLAAVMPDDIRVEWLVDADAMDRRVALAAARPQWNQVVHEVTRDPAMERIDRLQEEVARISRLLGDLAGARGGLPGTSAGYAAANDGYGGFVEQVRAPVRDFAAMPRSFVPEERTIERQRAKAVRRMLRQRRVREQYFPADLFADPAWDMLLDLYAARLERQPVSVSSLCIAAAVPATTALRWIKTMTDADIFVREADPHDGRRIFIALADGACEAMARYFEALEE